MSEIDEEETFSHSKDHDKIRSMIDEVIEFENRIPGFEIDESVMTIQQPELIEDQDTGGLTDLDETGLVSEPEIQKTGLKSRFKKLKLVRIKRKKPGLDKDLLDEDLSEIKPKTINPTEFTIGFNDEGKLVNLDLRKPKVESESESKLKKLGFLKKIIPHRKGKKSETAPSEGESKGSKLKSSFGKIGNLKKAIPFKGRKGKKE